MAEYMDPAMDAMEDAAGTAAEEAYMLLWKAEHLQQSCCCCNRCGIRCYDRYGRSS